MPNGAILRDDAPSLRPEKRPQAQLLPIGQLITRNDLQCSRIDGSGAGEPESQFAASDSRRASHKTTEDFAAAEGDKDLVSTGRFHLGYQFALVPFLAQISAQQSAIGCLIHRSAMVESHLDQSKTNSFNEIPCLEIPCLTADWGDDLRGVESSVLD